MQGKRLSHSRSPGHMFRGTVRGTLLGLRLGRTWAWWPPGQIVFSLDPFKQGVEYVQRE